MAHELVDLSLDEVSSVDDPANRGARVVLMKRNQDGRGTMDTEDERHSLLKRLGAHLGIRVNKTEDDSMPEGNVEKRLEELTTKMERLEADAELARKRADVMANIAKAAKAEDLDAVDKEVGAIEDEGVRKELGDMAKARRTEIEGRDRQTKHTDFRAKLPESLRKAFDALDDEGKDEFVKRMSDSQEGDPVAKALDEATRRADDLEKRLARRENEAELAKTAEELKELKGAVTKFDEFVGRVVKLRKADPTAADELIADMKAMAAQAKAGDLFKVSGKDGEGDESAEGRLDKAVRKRREANPDEDEATAMAKVLEDNPALYDEYNAEKEDK